MRYVTIHVQSTVLSKIGQSLFFLCGVWIQIRGLHDPDISGPALPGLKEELKFRPKPGLARIKIQNFGPNQSRSTFFPFSAHTA